MSEGSASPADVFLTENSPADDTQPAFSPDGKYIAFRSEREKGGLFIMGATGPMGTVGPVAPPPHRKPDAAEETS